MTEAEMQKALIRWARDLAAKHPCLEYLHAIPNGGARGRAVRVGAGVVRGMPDLMLPCVANDRAREWGWFAGLYIELKTPGGVVSEEQQRCHEYLRGAGYRVEVCRSVEEAQAAIIPYLEG